MTIPDAFLGADAILVLATNIVAGLEVQPAAIRHHVDREMPFMATERWLMLGVKAGGDRQTLHEAIRLVSLEVAEAVAKGGPNDLVERLAASPEFGSLDTETLRAELAPELYVGRAPEQVEEFVQGRVSSLLSSLDSLQVSDRAAVTV
jgi:adenylosuccinate lyase